MVTVSTLRPASLHVLVLSATALLMVSVVAGRVPVVPAPTTESPYMALLNTLPLAFIPNQGQFANGVQFQAQGKDSTVQFLQNEVILHLPADPAVRIQWSNSNPAPTLLAGEPLPGVINVLKGDDPAEWQTHIPLVAGVTYTNLYPGIDLHYDGHEGTLKGTYTVAAGAHPTRIQWWFHGATSATVDAATGDLRVTLPGGTTITEQAPVAWQMMNGQRQTVAVSYRVDGEQVGFTFPNGYNPAYSLIVDPTLIYSSYLGGNGTDEAKGITFDSSGNIYLVGETDSDDLLGYDTTPEGYKDIFVTKLNPAGTAVQYMSIIGSTSSDYALAIKVDAQGNAIVTGETSSETFPTFNALWDTPPNYWDSGVLFKLNGSGNVVYSTYLPLDVFDATHNLAVDHAGNSYVTGTARNITAPDDTYLSNEVGLYKISPDGNSLLMEKYYGAARDDASEKGVALTLDGAGNIYLVGMQESGEAEVPFGTPNAHQTTCGDITYGHSFCYSETVVFVVNPAGVVTYASYHGGSFTDVPTAIATDGQGNILVTGNTTSGQFPLVNALQSTCPLDPTSGDCRSARGYVSLIRLNATRATLTYSTYWGAPESDSTNRILAGVMDSNGNAYVTGYTNGRQFPLYQPIQSHLGPGFCTTPGSQRYCFDAFVTQFTPTGQLGFSTYFGATFDEYPYGLTLDPTGNIVIVGTTEASDFPTTGNAIQRTDSPGDDGFIVKIGLGATPPPPTVTPGGPTVTPSPTGQPLPPTVTASPTGQPVPPTVTPTPDPTLKKTYLPLVWGRK